MANAILLPPLDISSVTASATAAGYAASNVLNDYMGLVWSSGTGAATRTLTLDLGLDVLFDTLALFGLVGALQTWTWQIDLATSAQGAFSGSYWSGSSATLLAGTVGPLNGQGRALWQKPAGAPTFARYLRITFGNLSSAAVQVSRVCLGYKLQLARNFRYGAAFGVRPLGEVNWSARGVLLRRQGAKLRGLGISFFHAKRDEVEASIQPLLEMLGNDRPLVIVTDPDADAQRQSRMFFGLLTGSLGTVWARPGGFQADFNLIELEKASG